jgi:hypothetical protein
MIVLMCKPYRGSRRKAATPREHPGEAMLDPFGSIPG